MNRLVTHRLLWTFICCSCFLGELQAQVTSYLPGTDLLYYRETTRERREQTWQNMTQNGIRRKLQVPLRGDTEQNYLDAFWSIALTGFHTPEIDSIVAHSLSVWQERSPNFQVGLLELLHSRFPRRYDSAVIQLAHRTRNMRVFSAAIAYLPPDSNWLNVIQSKLADTSMRFSRRDSILIRYAQLRASGNIKQFGSLAPLRQRNWQPFNQPLVVSFQRHNRNFPGLVMVLDTGRKWMREADGRYFAVPQFARSVTNMPGIFTNGNTPQGLYRMKGFGVSKSNFIGPTANLQLTMPGETSPAKFTQKSISDPDWKLSYYLDLFPNEWKTIPGLQTSYWAGMMGRSEIIAHGTTLDPAWYKTEPYYPLTPTQGCLCASELWSSVDGKRMFSDQWQLAKMVAKAGGSDGYLLVIEINDKQEPVTLSEILSLLGLTP